MVFLQKTKVLNPLILLTVGKDRLSALLWLVANRLKDSFMCIENAQQILIVVFLINPIGLR